MPETSSIATNGRNMIRPDELQSEEVQELMGVIPHWIIRWGITMIFIVVLAAVGASLVIEYPDIITARITVTTQNPPVSVVARSSGKCTLFVRDSAYVEADSYLAAIESSANIYDVRTLRDYLERFDPADSVWIDSTFALPDSALVLGELQENFSIFSQNLQEVRFFRQSVYHDSRIRSIEQQIQYYRQLNRQLTRQKSLLTEEVKIAEEKYNNDKILHEGGHISSTALANTKSAFLQKKFESKNAETNIINNNIQLAEYRKTILDLNEGFSDDRRGLETHLRESYKQLLSKLDIWEQQFVLKAPISGRTSLFKFWSDNQYISAGDELMTIVPESGPMIGKVFLPAAGSGKVKTNQTVIIKFDSHPYKEFGTVEGIVENISTIARNNQYAITIALPNGLKTSYNTTLDFRQEMEGAAEIITEDLRIFDRVFNQMRYVVAASGRE